MNDYIKLNLVTSVPVYINKKYITAFHNDGDCSNIYTTGDNNYYRVKETIEEIIKLIDNSYVLG